MAKPVSGDTKKPYTAPVLTVHGTVRELTQHNALGQFNDGGTTGFRTKISHM